MTVASVAAERGRVSAFLRAEPWSYFAVPGLALLVGCFGAALVLIATQSLTPNAAANYSTVTNSVFLRSMLGSLQSAALVAAVSLILGYTYAYVMLTGHKAIRAILVVVLIAEYATSWLARAYAWFILLRPTGVINKALLDLGVIEAPLPLMRNTFGMVVGTVHVLLPFMVLTLYASMRQVDLSMMFAARTLGARRGRAFWTVLVPATLPGILAGTGLIFVLTLGFYITPALLGSQSDEMVTALIVTRTQDYGQFNVGAAMSVSLLGVTLAVLGLVGFVAGRLTRRMQGAR